MEKCNYNIQIEKDGKVFSFVIINLTTGEVVSMGREKTRLEAGRVANLRVRAMMKADKKQAAHVVEDPAPVVEPVVEVIAPVVVEKPAATKVKKAASKGWSAKRHANEEEDELQCTHCGEILSFDDFYNDRTNINGKQNHCKSCIKKHGKARRAAAKAAKETTGIEFMNNMTGELEFVDSLLESMTGENLPAVIQH